MNAFARWTWCAGLVLLLLAPGCSKSDDDDDDDAPVTHVDRPTTPPPAPSTAAKPAPAARTAPPRPEQGQVQVIVYGATWCGPCKKLKRELAARRVPFTFVDIDEEDKPADTPASMRSSIPITRVTQRSGQVVWVKGANAGKVERAYRG
jgi:glutaredoxin